jgi:uncharacterized protein YgiM (DUF1202 family)
MRSSHHRTLKVFMTASVLALAAGSTAAAATPAAQPNRTTTRCTLGKTFKYLPTTKARTLTVKANNSNIRRLPGTDCPIVATVNKSAKLKGTGKNAQLIGSSSKWTQVQGTFGLAWIANTLVM